MFLPFPRLPKELRNLIWKLASIPRVLSISKYFSHNRDAQYLYSTDPIPPILHTCHESRTESKYVTAFRMRSSPRYTWVDFDTDTIQMHDYVLRYVDSQELAQIRWAILDVDDSADFETWIYQDVCKMGGLQELTINTISDLRSWIERAEGLWVWMDTTPRANADWKRPMLKVIERRTGEQLDSLNFLEKSESLNERGEESLSGWEDGYDLGLAEKRRDRQELEVRQRDEDMYGPDRNL